MSTIAYCRDVSSHLCLKEQSVILKVSFYDKFRKILTKNGSFQNFNWFHYFVCKSYPVHDYVHWCCSIDCRVKLILGHENLWKNCAYFTLKWFPLEKCVFKRRALNRCKKINFWNFWEHLFEIWLYSYSYTCTIQ